MSNSPINRFPSGLKGIIVAGGDNHPDPQKLGRVKMFFPQIHGQDFDIEKAPWVQTQSSPNHSGPNSFDRPPQEGTVAHGDGITDSGHCYVSHTLTGKYQPSDLPSNFDLTKTLAWFARARNVVPKNASGPARVSQIREQNRNGTERITAAQIPESPAPSMAQRDGTPSHGAWPSFIAKYPRTTNIGTALQNATEAMTPEMANMIPGVPFNPANMLSAMPAALLSQVTKAVPKEVMTALTNSLALMDSYTPMSGTNFTNVSNNVNPDTFYPQVANTLMTLESVDQIGDILETIINSTSSHANNDVITIEIEGPFGNTIQQIFANGNIIHQQSNTVIAAQQAFESLISGITSADDSQNFMQNSDGPSEIIKKLIYRLPVSEQASLKEAIERKGKDIQKTLNQAAKTFFGGGATS